MTPAVNAERSVPRRVKSRKAKSGTLHDKILERLRDYIVEGNLADGARIPERELCTKFNISRTPLREALKVLASEGLVDLLPNRGSRVKRLDSVELRELFDLAGGLEALAGQLACENATAEDIVEIERIHHEMYDAYLRRDMHGYFHANQAIHEKIVRAARNAALASTYKAIADRIRRIRYTANLSRKRDRWSEAMREHEAMLDALHRRAGTELNSLLFQHLRNKREAAAEQLEKSDTSADAKHT
jgi:DNA-binding GntR family transcriptional regulator